MHDHANEPAAANAGRTPVSGRWRTACFTVVFGLTLGYMPSVRAQDFAIDSDRTHATFWVRPLWLKRIEGVFPVVEGAARRDRLSGALVVDLQIDTRALQMDRAQALVWAQGPEFFDTQSDPWIRFRSNTLSIERLAEGGPISGQLTLRGITRGVSLDLAPSRCERPGIDCPVEVSGELSRSSFGMDTRRLVLGDAVHLSIAVYLSDADTANTQP
ncbi:MAG TPA: YceI family protein [Chiayiivirga sp.]|nr:YceI family protein [Chiayiivirga sp.]